MSIVVYARQDVTSAVIEAVLVVLTLFITTTVQGIVLQLKARQVHKTGETYISESDLRDSANIPIAVIFDKRLWTVREFVTAILATIILVSSSTVLLGTEQTHCPFDADKYAHRTKLQKTLCYKERPISTSGEAYAPLVARFIQLIDEEPGVPVREHPSSFDLEKDEVVGDGVLTAEETWGTVQSIETCNFVITYARGDNGGLIGASPELLALTSDGSKAAPNPDVRVRSSRFGYLRDRTQLLKAISYFKEASLDNKTIVFMLTALIDEDDPAGNPETATCVKLTYDGHGQRVIPFANTAVQLMKTDGNMSRIAEVAWLGATLAEQIPRQTECTRTNYKRSQCVQISVNTIATVGVAAGLAVVLAMFAIILAVLNRSNPVKNKFTQFQLLLSAIYEGRNEAIMKSTKRVRLTFARNEDGSGQLYWDSERKPVRPDDVGELPPYYQ